MTSGAETTGSSPDASTDGTSSSSGMGESESSGSESESSGGETGSAEVDPLPPGITLCDPSAPEVFTSETGGEGSEAWIAHSCAVPCEALSGCTRTEGAFTSAYVVVEGLGAEVRWAEGDDLVFFHNGGTGTTFPEGMLVERALTDGHGVAMVRWDAGSFVGDREMGWTSRPSAQPTDFVELTGRIALVMTWMHTMLEPDGFGTAGCSAGAYVTFAARLWHGFDPRLDYQLFVGGPPFDNLGWGCSDGTAPAHGRCVGDLGTLCETDDDCTGPISSCSPFANHAGAPLSDMVDSIHLTAPHCAEGVHDPAWSASNPFETDADWANEHPVDFLLNVGGPTSDAGIGALANAWTLAQGLRGEVGWHETPGPHCAAFASEQAWDLLAAGMGWSG